jgi:hypothetical protein
MEKKLLVVLVVVGLCSTVALALDPLGPPTAGLKAGKFSTALEYAHSKMDLEMSGMKWSGSEIEVEVDDGESGPGSGIYKSKGLKDLKQNKVYANIGYGITDYWEVFLRLGGSDIDAKWDERDPLGDPNESENYDIDTSMSFVWGLGTKATFYKEGNLSLGALFQIHFSDFELDRGSSYAYSGTTYWEKGTEKMELNFTEMQLAVGPTYELAPGFCVYGGGFWHDVDGEYKENDREIDSDGNSETDKKSADIKEESSFGGYIGLKADIAENTSLNGEWQHTSDADLFAATLVFRF